MLVKGLGATTFLLLSIGAAAAESLAAPTDHAPKICLSYNGEDALQPWGVPRKEDCPKNHAAFGGRRGIADSQVTIYPVCCPLPADDILLEEHRYVENQCPPEYIVTGGSLDRRPLVQNEKPLVRCTKVNLDRYILGETTPGVFWGYSSVYWQIPQRFLKRSIPAAIRASMGRQSEFEWETRGCIGYPFGSVLTARSKKQCRYFSFRQLQFRGMDGDPPVGTAVQMFPDCRSISSDVDPEPECRN